jgi:hypothetical protein
VATQLVVSRVALSFIELAGYRTTNAAKWPVCILVGPEFMLKCEICMAKYFIVLIYTKGGG